jgi:hypothetical protein
MSIAYDIAYIGSMTNTERLAYFAGFFDGEGCIQLCRTTARNRIKNPIGGVTIGTTVVNTERPPLELMQSVFGGTIHNKTKGYKSRYGAYYWMIHGKKAAPFLAAILPYLIIKRDQAEAALVFAETYHNPWRDMTSGRPLSEQGRRLRTIAFRAFRRAMDDKLGRGISWAI